MFDFYDKSVNVQVDRMKKLLNKFFKQQNNQLNNQLTQLNDTKRKTLDQFQSVTTNNNDTTSNFNKILLLKFIASQGFHAIL